MRILNLENAARANLESSHDCFLGAQTRKQNVSEKKKQEQPLVL